MEFPVARLSSRRLGSGGGAVIHVTMPISTLGSAAHEHVRGLRGLPVQRGIDQPNTS